MENPKLEQALTYASWGWHVLPVRKNGKAPATENGVYDATTDPQKIANWFLANPDLNIGIAAGSKSGIVVIDIDPRNGGEETLESLKQKLGDLPDTQVQLTGGGGTHLIFAYREGLRKRKIDEGVDFLSNGGYFIASPSVVDNKPYNWEVNGDPHDGVCPAELPQTWVEQIESVKATSAVGDQLIRGNRHSGLVAMAGVMRHYGMTPSEILASLQVANATRCECPLPASEVAQIANSMAKYDPTEDVAADAALGAGAVEAILADQKKEKQGFYLTSGNELTSQPAAIEWVIRNWIPDRGTSMVFGESGVGKSFLTIDMALCICTGKDWLGNKVKQGAVLYLAGEGNFGIRQRLKAWCQFHGVDDIGNFYLSNRPVDLDVQQDLYMVVRETMLTINEHISVVVIDTVNNHLSGDENLATDTRSFINSCNFLSTQFGCSVCLNHHVGHSLLSKGRARGSSAWKAALDSSILIEKEEDTGVITIENVKQKDAQLMQPQHAKLHQITLEGWEDSDGQPVTSAVVVPSEEGPEGSEEEKAPPVDKKLAEYRKTVEIAWVVGGCRFKDKLPFVSKVALKDTLLDKGFAVRTVNNYMNPKYTDKLVGRLETEGFLQPAKNGWVVVEPITVTVLSLVGNPNVLD